MSYKKIYRTCGMNLLYLRCNDYGITNIFFTLKSPNLCRNHRGGLFLLEVIMEEVWKDIPKYKGMYQISNFGRVRSWNNNGNNRKGRRASPKYLKIYVDSLGYKSVAMCINSTPKRFRIHRLLCQVFKKNPCSKKHVNHIDGNKKNNCLSNLEWVTPKENSLHAKRIGLIDNLGQKNGNSKLSLEDVKEIKYGRNYNRIKLSKKLGVTKDTISAIRNGKSWGHV